MIALAPSHAILVLSLAVTGDPFKIAMLPDTQHYSQFATLAYQFEAQTQWIVDNLATEALVFATMAGDLVQSGANPPSSNQAEWDRAVEAMDRLDGDLVAQPDGILPYATVPGNHDYDVIEQKGSLVQYLAHFGPVRYAGRSWFVGGSLGDSAQTFTTPDYTLLHIALEWRPSDRSIEWAQGVMAANPTTPTFLTTHAHLQAGIPATRLASGSTPNSGGDNSGVDLYSKLVEPFPQAFMLLCGHIPGDGRIESTTAMSFDVIEVLADYQDDPNGGNGWMQILTFRPDQGVVDFSTFSPTYVPGVTAGPDRSQSPASNYSLALDLDQLVSDLNATTTLRFREGQDLGQGVYGGAVDTFVGDGAAGGTPPNVSKGTAEILLVDGDENREQSLLRFDGIVGTGPGQIPPGATVLTAILTLTTEGLGAESSGGGSLHRMLVPWDESSTWNSLGGGIQTGAEANPTADISSAELVAVPGTDSLDVTTSVQAWVDGQANLGWAILANGNDDWSVRSSDWESVAERPLLTVRIDAPALPVTYCTAGTSASGCNATLSATGTPSATATAGFSLQASGVEGGKFGLFYIGVNGRQANPWGNGTSYQCVVPPVWRGGTLAASGTAGQCDGSYAQDWNATWCATCPKPAKNPGAGVVVQGQLWYRDPLNTSNQTTSTSNAIEFTVGS